MGAEVRQFPGCSGVSGGVGGRASGGAAGHDTTKRRDVSRAPRYRPQPRDTVVVVVVVVLLLIIILAGARLEPRDQRPPTDREIDGGRRIFDRTFDLCRDPRSRRGTRRIEGGRRAACTRVARTRLRRRAVVAASASRSCRHRACVREHVFEPPPTTDCYEPPCVRPNDCPSRDHGRHMFVIRSVHEMYAVSS